jgi:hypothetical protein
LASWNNEQSKNTFEFVWRNAVTGSCVICFKLQSNYLSEISLKM